MPNAAAGASAPMLRFESPASAGLSNLYLAEAKSADAVLPNAAAGASAPMLRFESDTSVSLSNVCRRRSVHFMKELLICPVKLAEDPVVPVVNRLIVRIRREFLLNRNVV